MDVIPYLHFNGNCAEAFAHYGKLMGGKVVMVSKYSDSPMANDMPADMRDKIIHIHMQIGNTVLMGSDAPPQHYCKAARLQYFSRSENSRRSRSRFCRLG